MARAWFVILFALNYLPLMGCAFGGEIPGPIDLLENAATELLAVKPTSDGTRDSLDEELSGLAIAALRHRSYTLSERVIAAIGDEDTKGATQEAVCRMYVQRREFKRALEEIKLIAPTNSSVNNYRMFVASELVSTAVRFGHLSEAKRALDFFEPRDEVKEFWEVSASEVAIAMAQFGESSWVKEITDSNSAVAMRLAVGLALRDEERGHHADAMNRLIAVKVPLDRPYLVEDLAEGFAKIGDFDGADKIVRQLPNDSDHFFRGWSRLGQVAAKRRDIGKAFEYVAILGRRDGPKWITGITIELARAGEVDAAMDAISLHSPTEPNWPAISWTLLPIFLERRDTAGIIACVNAAPNGNARLNVLSYAVGLERNLAVPTGHFSVMAHRCIAAMASEVDRLRGLIRLADGHLANHNHAEAMNAARHAVAAYDVVLHGPEQLQMKLDETIRFELLDCLLRCNLLVEATRLVKEFPNNERLASQIRVAAATGNAMLIRETILRLSEGERNEAVDTYVYHLCKRHDYATAFSLVQLAPDPIFRAHCLIVIVNAMAEPNESADP